MTDSRTEGSIFKALRQVKRQQFSVDDDVKELCDNVGDLRRSVDGLQRYIGSYVQDERHGDKVSKRLVAGLTATFVLAGSLLAYDIWESRRNRQIMNAVLDGTAVVGVGAEWYAVHQKDAASNAACKQFEVSKVILSHLNNRPAYINTKPAATFTIPDGCNAGPGTPPRPDAHILTRSPVRKPG